MKTICKGLMLIGKVIGWASMVVVIALGVLCFVVVPAAVTRDLTNYGWVTSAIVGVLALLSGVIVFAWIILGIDWLCTQIKKGAGESE